MRTYNTQWIRNHQAHRGFRRLNKRDLPHFDNHIVAYTGAIEALKRERGMTWDEIRAYLENNSGIGMEGVVYEAMIRTMDRPEWADSVNEWRALDRSKETQDALSAWLKKKQLLPPWKCPELSGGFFL